MPDTRTLTDADILALVQALRKPVATEIKNQMIDDFQLDLGRSVIVWARRATFSILIALAIWAASHAGGYILPAQQPRR